jgi:hypothetical protein
MAVEQRDAIHYHHDDTSCLCPFTILWDVLAPSPATLSSICLFNYPCIYLYLCVSDNVYSEDNRGREKKVEAGRIGGPDIYWLALLNARVLSLTPLLSLVPEASDTVGVSVHLHLKDWSKLRT